MKITGARIAAGFAVVTTLATMLIGATSAKADYYWHNGRRAWRSDGAVVGVYPGAPVVVGGPMYYHRYHRGYYYWHHHYYHHYRWENGHRVYIGLAF